MSKLGANTTPGGVQGKPVYCLGKEIGDVHKIIKFYSANKLDPFALAISSFNFSSLRGHKF
jgi:hypothetical protein